MLKTKTWISPKKVYFFAIFFKVAWKLRYDFSTDEPITVVQVKTQVQALMNPPRIKNLMGGFNFFCTKMSRKVFET